MGHEWEWLRLGGSGLESLMKLGSRYQRGSNLLKVCLGLKQSLERLSHSYGWQIYVVVGRKPLSLLSGASPPAACRSHDKTISFPKGAVKGKASASCSVFYNLDSDFILSNCIY